MTDDKEIISLLFNRSEYGISELDSKYGGICHKIALNITGNLSDAEECVNDAYLGIWNKIPPENPQNLLTYLCKIVRNLSLKRHRLNTVRKRAGNYDLAMEELGECLASSSTVETEIDGKALTSIIEDFLDTLSPENRTLFLRRYWFAESYAEIAGKVEISEKTVSVRLVRLREKLKKYLSERGVMV